VASNKINDLADGKLAGTIHVSVSSAGSPLVRFAPPPATPPRPSGRE